MNSFQRIRLFLSGVFMLLGSVILYLEEEDGYYFIAAFLSLSMILSGIRSLIYYFTMARNMVGGKSMLYGAIILLDMGMFTLTTISIPQIYLICHLLITYGFSGAADMMKAYEDKKMEAPSWKLSFLYGLGNLLVAVTAFACIINKATWLVVDIYSAGLAYAAVMRMASSFRKTAIIYIP